MSPHVTPGAARAWPGAARLAVVLVALLALANLLAQVSWGLDAPPKTDYLAFATGARVLHDQPSCLYCDDVQTGTQASILGYVPTAGFPKPYVNPPLVALLLEPLSGLPLRTGLAVLMLVLLGVLALAARVFVRLLPGAWPPSLRLLLVVSSLVSLPAATAVGLAQWAPVLVLAALGAVTLLRGARPHPMLAGVLLSVLLIKPQTVWLVLPALVFAGAWRVLLGFFVGAAGWFVSGLVLVGWDQMLQWPRLVLDRQVDEAHRTAGIPGVVTSIAGGDRAAFVAAVVLAGLALVGMGLAARRLRGRADVAIALGVALSMVCAPHVFPDDLMLLGVTLAVWAPRTPRLAVACVLAVSVAYQVDGWLPSSVAHLTALAALCVAVGAGWSLLARRAAPLMRGAGASAAVGAGAG